MAHILAAASVALLVMAWLAPLHIPPWVAAHSEMLSAAAVLVLSSGALVKRPGVERIQLPKPAIFMLTLALIPGLQFATGLITFAGDAWIAILYLTCAAWAIVGSAQLARQDAAHWATTLAVAVLLGAMASAFIAFLQRFAIDLGPLGMHMVAVRPGYPPGANLSQPNQLATLLGLGLVALLLLFELGRAGLASVVAGAVLLTAAMAATQSRTPVLLFGAGWLGLLLIRRRTHLRTSPIAPIGLAALWAAAMLAWPRMSAVLELTPMRATLESRAHAGPRIVIWEQLWDAVWLRPWTGFGWNQVSIAQMAFAGDYPNSRLVEHSHNLALDLLIWNGVPLGILIAGLALWWLWGATRRVQTPVGAFGLLILLLLLAHSMVEFPLEYLYFLVPFAMALGLVEVDSDSTSPLSLVRSAGVIGTLAMGTVFVAAVIDYMNLESSYREMRFTIARIGRPMVSEPPPMLVTQFTQLAAQHHVWLTSPHDSMSEQEQLLVAEVSARYGYAPLLYRQALTQALNGNIQGARESLLRLRNLHQFALYRSAMDEIATLAADKYPQLHSLVAPAASAPSSR